MIRWSDRKYQTIAHVTVTFHGRYAQTFVDAMDGLNLGHAMWRARDSCWEGAKVTLRYASSRTKPNLPK